MDPDVDVDVRTHVAHVTVFFLQALEITEGLRAAQAEVALRDERHEGHEGAGDRPTKWHRR